MRVPVSPLWTSMFSALGASPTSINFSEVYSALQTHIVDGQENPLNLIDTAKLYEVQKYCSLTNHMWDGFWFLANRRAWDQLPKDVQEVVAREIDRAALAERADIANANKEVKTALAGKGLIFNDVEPPPSRAKLKQAGFYKEWRGKYGEDAWQRARGERRPDFVTAVSWPAGCHVASFAGLLVTRPAPHICVPHLRRLRRKPSCPSSLLGPSRPRPSPSRSLMPNGASG